MKKLYECMPVGERAWLARVAFLGAVLWIGIIVAVALAPTVDEIESAALVSKVSQP